MTTRDTTTFEFVDDITGFRAPNVFVVRLAGRLRRKRDLLRALAAELKFPGYFGCNWDALEECLSDLSWLDGHQGIAIVHKHVPLLDDRQRAIYLDILQQAQLNQRLPLRMIFPLASRSEVERSVARSLQ